MTTNQLACFLAVAECNSFTQAANQLYISHSAVSKAVSSLEDNLGVQLFKRDKQSVAMTEAGKELYERGKHLYSLWTDLEQRISRTGTASCGSLSIFSPSPNCPQMMSIYQSIRQQFPKTVLDIQYSDPSGVCRAVRQGHADLGITYSFFLSAQDTLIDSIPLFEDEFVAVVPPNHPLFHRDRVDSNTVLLSPQIFPPQAHATFSISVLKGIQRPVEERDFQARNINEVLLQISLGTGCAILPRTAVDDRPGNYRCIPLTDQASRFHQILLWRSDRSNAVMSQLIHLAQQQFSSQAPQS